MRQYNCNRFFLIPTNLCHHTDIECINNFFIYLRFIFGLKLDFRWNLGISKFHFWIYLNSAILNGCMVNCGHTFGSCAHATQFLGGSSSLSYLRKSQYHAVPTSPHLTAITFLLLLKVRITLTILKLFMP